MAYGAKGERNGLHVAGKHQHAWWAWDSEWIALTRIAQYHRLGSVTHLLSSIAHGVLTVKTATDRDQAKLRELTKDAYDIHSRTILPLSDDDRDRIKRMK